MWVNHMDAILGPILTILAIVMGGVCTFKGAAYGARQSAKETRKLRDQEIQARRTALLRTLRRQIALCERFTLSEPGQFRNAMLLHISSLAPLLLDGQLLRHPHDDQLQEALLLLDAKLQASREFISTLQAVSRKEKTEEQARSLDLSAKQVADSLTLAFKTVIEAIDASEPSEHKQLPG
jgi:hypothetical protein